MKQQIVIDVVRSFKMTDTNRISKANPKMATKEPT